MPLYLFYTMVQKVKNDQKLKSRGSFENGPRPPFPNPLRPIWIDKKMDYVSRQ